MPVPLSSRCHSFLDALRGAPQVDLNSDGVITFEETARYIRGEMSFFESQTASFGTSPTFNTKWGMAIVSGKKSHTRIGEYVEILGDEEPESARIDDFKDGKFKVRFASSEERRAEWVTAELIRTIAFMP